MLLKWIKAFLPLVLIILVPVLLRQGQVIDDPNVPQLVVMTPHNEAIRYEFERAFRQYCRETHDMDVDIDWRSPGGTSEIVRYIRSEYLARFQQEWTSAGNRWSNAIMQAVLNPRASMENAGAEGTAARAAFTNGSTGIGIDVFFGGGQYDYGRLAAEGILVDAGVRDRHPEWFTGDHPPLDEGMSGEIWSDPRGHYYGACLAAFGICYSFDRLQELNAPPPQTWYELGNPRFRGQIGAADPSKSGSINKCFEMLIQQVMQEQAAASGYRDGTGVPPELLARGWHEAMTLIKKIGGNSRYFTFAAGKVPVDVSHGELCAGMCIDFYGRSQAEWSEAASGKPVMAYLTPEGGSSVSADPIALFRGAPHPDLAREFLDFVLSPRGQKLWNYRVGTPGGPEKYALRRLPIRRDLYSDEHRQYMSDPQARPFELAERFTYHPEWTGRLFNLIRLLLRVMIIDCHPELKDAWKAIADAGGPDAVPEAMVAFSELPFTYLEAGDVASQLGDSNQRLALMRDWVQFFRRQYIQTQKLAEAR